MRDKGGVNENVKIIILKKMKAQVVIERGLT